jgi:hypothetical protein
VLKCFKKGKGFVYLCGLGHALTEYFDLNVTEIGVQSDGHVAISWHENSASLVS